MGPQHPSTHGVLRLVLRTDGEIVSEVDAAHRLSASLRREDRRESHAAAVDSVHRPDGLSGRDEHESRLVAGVEKLMNYRVPEKGRHLRVIIAEMNRIASHLVGMGAYGLDLGTFSPFLYAFREREKILDLFEEACGARLTYSYLTLGGATADLPRGWTAEVRSVPRPIRAAHRRVSHAAHDERDLREAHGRHRRAVARDGDQLRHAAARCCAAAASITTCAATAKRSTRRCTTATPSKSSCERDGHYPKDHEYPPVPHEAVLGDCWHRFYVRMLEVVQSVDLVRQAIDRYNTATGSFGEPMKLTAEAAQGRGVSGNRMPEGPDGLLSGQLGRLDSVARAGPQQLLLQPLGHQRALPRLPDRRRAGDRRLARHRDGRDRSVSVANVPVNAIAKTVA